MSLSALDNFIKDPAPALVSVVENRTLKSGMVGYFLAALSLTIFFNIGSGLNAVAFLLQLLMCFLILLANGFFYAAMAHLFLDFFTKKGSGSGLFAVIGISCYVSALLIPCALLSAMTPAVNSVKILLGFCVAVLQVFVLFSLVAKAYKTSWFLALCAMATGVALLMLPIFLFFAGIMFFIAVVLA